MAEKKYQKPPIVYQGNKFRLLKKIAPYMPIKVDELLFVDVFGGSSCMTLNFGNKAIYNDSNNFISNMIRAIYTDKPYILQKFNEWTKEYDLIQDLNKKENIEVFKANYNKFREYANSLNRNTKVYIAAIYTCHIFAINNLIRFNKRGGYNASSGHRFKNSHPTKKLEQFVVPEKHIVFASLDYKELLLKISKIDNNKMFVYLDPPYIGTTAVYNENRFTGWSEENDIELFKLLDLLHSKGIKWMLSNTMVGKDGVVNENLRKWSEKYVVINFNHKYSSFGKANTNNQEVIIINYKKGDKICQQHKMKCD